jgi:hypothetical protein
MVPSQVAVGARTVLDDHRLAERLAEVVDDLPAQRVGRTTWHERDDQPDWPVGIA